MIFVRVIVAMAAAAGLKLALGSVLAPEALHVEVHAVGAYLAVLGALYGIIVAFLMFKDKRSDPQKEYVYWHARQGFALLLVVVALVIVMSIGSVILGFIPVLGWLLSCFLWLGIMVICLGGSIMGWVKAFGGEKWPMPGVCKIAEMFK